MFNSVSDPYRTADGGVAFVGRPAGKVILGGTATMTPPATSLMIFDKQGRFVRRIGRTGRGPGEYENIGLVLIVGNDRFVVVDGSLHRVTMVSAAGALLESRPLPARCELAGFFSDGAFLCASTLPPSGGSSHTQFDRVDSSGGRRPIAGPLFLRPSENGVWQPHASRAVSGSTLYYAPGANYEVLAFSEDGRLLRIIRLERAERIVTSADIESYKKVWADRFAQLPGQIPPVWRPDQFADRFPAIEAIRVDREGNLWVRETTTTIFDPQHWTVFDATGRLLATVETPARMFVNDIGPDYILGGCMDNEGEMIVCMYGLLK